VTRRFYESALLWLRVSLCLVLIAVTSGAISAEPFAITKVHRFQFIETALSGAKKVYRGYAADIAAPGEASNEEMERFAKDLFETRLKAMTESEQGEIVWITFNLKDGKYMQGQFAHTTYRVIFMRENGRWGPPPKKQQPT
jgi:hypothetical protein